MPGKSTLAADAAEQAALRALSKSEQRGEADRARAILLTLEGRRAGEIAAAILSGDVRHEGLSQTLRRPRDGSALQPLGNRTQDHGSPEPEGKVDRHA
jgi:hypothetical protein